jgi:hypothetical protein
MHKTGGETLAVTLSEVNTECIFHSKVLQNRDSQSFQFATSSYSYIRSEAAAAVSPRRFYQP